MFERFSSLFTADAEVRQVGGWHDAALEAVAGYSELMGRFAGCSFDGGVYRLHSAISGPVGQELAAAAFPELADRVRVFGFDWLGRQAAVDFGRVVDGEPQVLLLEPGSGEALEIPVGFEWFHDEEIVDYRDEALAVEFFAQWRSAQGGAGRLTVAECVGYKVPLFLGGADVVENLELTDFEVYWDFCGQLRRQTRGLPTGTPIRGVIVEE
jgi:hypothetical protein